MITWAMWIGAFAVGWLIASVLAALAVARWFKYLREKNDSEDQADSPDGRRN
jgi:membrane protein implicated in regulation of membrane protease activity